MPPLSEAWATAYVQVLTMLVIFALGIPALAIQFVVQDDIRTVFQRRWKSTIWFMSVASIVVTFIAFIWILHFPFKNIKSSQAKTAPSPEINIPLRVIAPTLTENNPSLSNVVITLEQSKATNPATDDEDESSMTTPITSFLMTAILLGLLGIGFVYTIYLKRHHIIRELENDLIEDFCEKKSSRQSVGGWFTRRLSAVIGKKPTRKRRSKKRGRSRTPDNHKFYMHHMDEEMLGDLIYLGRSGKAGRDKTLVLSSLDHLAAVVQNSDKYQGDELEDLIRGLKETVLNTEQPADGDNFNHAVEILKGIRYRLAEKAADVPKYIDAGLANIVLEDLGIEAIKNQSGHIAERCLEEASSYSKIIFKIGAAALYNKQFHIAIVALNKLEALAEDKDLAACSETFDLLGLLAHFTLHGTASSMRVASFLFGNITSFSPSINDCLVKAYEHHYENSDFETADAVVKLNQVVRNKNWEALLSLPV